MSSLAPVPPPETGGDGGGPPPSPSAPSPGNDDISPPPAPVFPSLPPLLSSPPLGSGPIAALSPLPVVVVVGATPPLTSPILPSPPPLPLPHPILSPPQPQPQPQPQTQPPLASPPPISKDNPPPQKPTQPTPSTSPPSSTKPTPTSRGTIPSIPSSPLPPRNPPRPVFQQPKTRGSTTTPPTQPNPFPKGPSRPRPKIITPSAASPLPTSAVIPSLPPVALPVPQAPSGGAWLPFTPEPPSPLPVFPHPSGAPLFFKPNNGIPSAFAPSDSSADHQNIEAAHAAPSSSGMSNGSSGLLVGLCAAGVLLLLLGAVFAILVCFCRRREKKFADYKSGSKHGTSFGGYEDKASRSQYKKEDPNTSGHQVLVNVNASLGQNFSTSSSGIGTSLCSGSFTYEELAGATNGFSEENLLGQGGFGYVHKGVLPNGKEVAVKQLKMGGHQGEREFRAEVETISQVHHKHLVSLVGYCISGAERLLVYEFVTNNTMDFHLHGKGQPAMDWPTRLKIAIGSAKGLAYLHEDCNPTIIHRDIKAANILLNHNFEAKVSDFGLAKIFTNTDSSVTHLTTRVVGTFGYLAPEYASSGKVTDKSDVYSYGVMLLELITGRPPISNSGSATNGGLVNWARPLLTQAIGDGNFESLIDPQLQSNYDVDEMASMVACAAACVRLSAWRRPRMSQVVHALEGNFPLSELDNGTRPGHSAMHFPYESLDFDARNYIDSLKRMSMTSNVNGYTNTTSRSSENASEYGLQFSASTTETSYRESLPNN